MEKIKYNGQSKILIRICEKMNAVIDALGDGGIASSTGNGTMDVTNVDTSAASKASYVKWGQCCSVDYWIKLASAVSGRYSEYLVATGLPPAIGTQCSMASCIDDAGADSYLSVNGNGELKISARNTALAGKTIVGGFTYVTKANTDNENS